MTDKISKKMDGSETVKELLKLCNKKEGLIFIEYDNEDYVLSKLYTQKENEN